MNPNFFNNIVQNENITKTVYTSMHIIIATVFVLCLKQHNQIILTLLLTAMVAYLINDSDGIQLYTLPAIGVTIYLLDILISLPSPSNTNTYTNNQSNLLNTIWKIPYWSIVGYYFIVAIFLLNVKILNLPSV